MNAIACDVLLQTQPRASRNAALEGLPDSASSTKSKNGHLGQLKDLVKELNSLLGDRSFGVQTSRSLVFRAISLVWPLYYASIHAPVIAQVDLRKHLSLIGEQLSLPFVTFMVGLLFRHFHVSLRIIAGYYES